MNVKLKAMSVVISLFVGSVASAYQSDLNCGNMIRARASIAAAQELVEKDSKVYNKLEGIMTTIKNGLIFRHCDLSKANNVAGSVRVPVRAVLFKCPQEVATIGLIDQATESLKEATSGVFGGYRQGAINRSTALSQELKEGLKSDSSCN